MLRELLKAKTPPSPAGFAVYYSSRGRFSRGRFMPVAAPHKNSELLTAPRSTPARIALHASTIAHHCELLHSLQKSCLAAFGHHFGAALGLGQAA
jgi:hypothetical protein